MFLTVYCKNLNLKLDLTLFFVSVENMLNVWSVIANYEKKENVQKLSSKGSL